jgi:dienelactone hydrolase
VGCWRRNNTARPRRRWLGLSLAVLGTLWVCPSAQAAQPPLRLTDCGPAQGVYQCSGLVQTWDGVPLDTTVTLPSKSSKHLPVVAETHGFGNSKYEYLDPGSTAYTDNAFAWAKDGYAVLTYTARGLWGSCGTPEARAANPQPCAGGYIHLADVRYEVRDTQELLGRLIDQGYAAPRIGVTGDSYGGGQSLMLAALRDRMMLPDGRLVPWRSPDGRRLQVGAAAPVIPWSDLISAAAPNGRVKANGITSRQEAQTPVGVEKASFVNGIAAAAQFATGPGQPVGEPFVPGRPMGFLAPAGTDPQADVLSWVARTNAGEPYTDSEAQTIIRLLTRYHSPYYIDPSRAPAPLLIASGFTDDLFPVDEALRFANRTRSLYPRNPLSLVFGDFGHQRAANKPAERSELLNRVHGWFDRYLRGRGTPPQGVTAYVQTCPRSLPSGGPFHAPTFAQLTHRQVHFAATGRQTVSSAGGDPAVAAAIDPVTGGDSCVSTSAAAAPGTARYVLKRKGAPPFTLIGAPLLRADLVVSGAAPENAQLDARLWDVAPDGGSQRLVARGTYRPGGGDSWQLHPGAWRFGRDHAAVLELVGSDAPYARPSNGVFEVEVRNLQANLPAP